MRHLNYYDGLSKKNVRELKENLLKWAEQNPNGILLFDTKIIPKIHRRMTEQKVCGYSFGNGLCIEDIQITWNQLPGGKGILKSIKRKKTNNTTEELYKDVCSWEEASLWYQFRLE